MSREIMTEEYVSTLAGIAPTVLVDSHEQLRSERDKALFLYKTMGEALDRCIHTRLDLQDQVLALTLRAEQAERLLAAEKLWAEQAERERDAMKGIYGTQYAKEILEAALTRAETAQATLTALLERLDKLPRFPRNRDGVEIVRWTEVQAALSPEEKTP